MKKFLVGILLLIVSIFFMRDMAKPGLPMLHDSNPHIARMIAFHTALVDGQFPPMWAKELLGGIGSPVMMLNYQLPYFISEGFVRMGLGYFDAYKATLALSFILSAALMYLALLSRYKPLPAYMGAMIYTLAPYRFVDIYVRGALGESLSFIFPPLILWGFAKSLYPLQIIGWAGLFLTHPVAAATFSAFFLLYTLLFGKQTSVWAKLKDFFIPYFIALSIAMFNLLPTLWLTRYTYYDPSLSDTLLMFPTLSQLIKSPWGYGVSLPGPNDGMSFEVGVLGWIILLVGTVWAVIKKHKQLGYLSVMTWITVLLILPVSLPLYGLFLGRIIDFPWRLLMCVVFATAWMGAMLSQKIKDKGAQIIVTAITTVVMIVLSLPIAHTDKYWDVRKDVAFFSRETGDSYGEYAPIWRKTRDSSPFGLRAEYIHGMGNVTVLEEKSNLQKFSTHSDKPGYIRINTNYFPGWNIKIDGVKQRITLPECHDCGATDKDDDRCYVTTRSLPQIDDSGLMVCGLRAADHEVILYYTTPTVQRVADLVTLLGIGGFIWILFQSFYPRSTKKTR
jgi:hypothetical protein